jgi:hypothetical protein
MERRETLLSSMWSSTFAKKLSALFQAVNGFDSTACCHLLSVTSGWITRPLSFHRAEFWRILVGPNGDTVVMICIGSISIAAELQQ